MSISTGAPQANHAGRSRAGVLYALSLFLPGIVGDGIRRRQLRKALLICGTALLLLGFTSCGGASIGGGGGGSGPHTTTYTVTVSASAGSINHNITVALLVTQ